MKNILMLFAVATICSGCAVGAGVSGFSLVSGSLTQQAEKNLIDKAYNEFKVKEMKDRE